MVMLADACWCLGDEEEAGRWFRAAVVADPDEKVGECREDQMMMEALPGTALVMIEAEIVFSTEEVL